MTIPQMPVELVDMVIDYLHAENLHSPDYLKVQRILCACTLVSRTWHSIAVPHLFRDVCCTFAQMNKMVLINNTVVKQSSRTLSTFFTFLQNSPDIAKSIRSLQLRQLDFQSQAEGENCFEAHHKVDYLEFLAVLKAIPRLQELYLVNFVVCRPQGVSFPASQRSLSRLHISYDGVYTTPLDFRVDLQALIACAGSIGRLDLGGIDQLSLARELSKENGSPFAGLEYHDLFTADPPVARCVALDHIEEETEWLVEFFATCVRAESVRSLILGGEEPSLYNELLASVGLHLERLQIFMGMSFFSASIL